LNTCVYAPVRVLGSSILSIKGHTFLIRGSKSNGIIYTGLKLSLFRLYVVKNDSLDISFPTMWLGITLSCGPLGLGIGFSGDLWGSGMMYAETRWICSVLSEHGI